MSSFRFTDLPEEIRVWIAKEVVNEFAWPNQPEHEVIQERRLSRLKEFSVMNSIFTKSAQSHLFRFLTFSNVKVMERFLVNIRTKSFLGLMVQRINLECERRGIINGVSGFASLLDYCGNLLSLLLKRVKLDFLVLSRAKSRHFISLFENELKIDSKLRIELEHLDLSEVYVLNSSQTHTFKNLQHLHISLSTIAAPVPFAVDAFPALSTLELYHVKEFKLLQPLFTKLENLYFEPITDLIKEELIQNFTTLKCISFRWTDSLISITEALLQIASPLSAIRFHISACRKI